MNGYGDFAYYYDSLTHNVEYEKRAEYIYGLLAENGVGKGILLDLACGTGTLSLLLEKKGFDVLGVDASEDMLSVAQEKKMSGNSNAIFLCQKMQDLDLFGTIDAAVCTLDSINHVTDENDVKEILRKVALFMNDGGIFIFDVNTLYKHREILANNTFVYDTEEVFCVWQNTLCEDNVVEIDLDFFELDEDGAYIRSSESFCEKAYPHEKIVEMLENAGFRQVITAFTGCMIRLHSAPNALGIHFIAD